MKKIMFDDRHLLTKKVIDGSKTQTRRVCKRQVVSFSTRINANVNGFFDCEQPQYKKGEELAVAWPYREVLNLFPYGTSRSVLSTLRTLYGDAIECLPGYSNKLFVRPGLMPYRIKIEDVKIERLSDITDRDCMSEGIRGYNDVYFWDSPDQSRTFFESPRGAFAHMVDRICGRGTWAQNPWVFRYDFKLINKPVKDDKYVV